MLKRRALYAAVIIMAAGLAFWSGSPFLAAMTALLVLLPLLLFWLLRRDMGAVTMSLQVPASCPVGKPCPITVYITCPRRPWVMGLITLRIRWHNGMFDDVVEQERRLYLSDGVIQFQVSITSDLCGAAEVSCLSAVGTDILGLCAGSIPCPKPSSVIVVPTPLSLRLVPAENRLGRMDNELEFFNRRGPEFSEIFDLHGEAYFRNEETNLLKEVGNEKNKIVSCGGGVAMREVNVQEMRKSGKVILLTAKPETILERVKENHDRPLLENNKTVEYVSELMEKRRPAYEAAADIVIATDGKSANEICEEIIAQVKKFK